MKTRTALTKYGAVLWGPLLGSALILTAGANSAWGQSGGGPSVEQAQPPKVNQALPGARKGILTNATRGTVRIGRDTYTLAPDVILEDDKGQSLTLGDLSVFNGFDQGVVYWLGTGQAANRITQMIVQFPQ
jgi:hypothetical protein